MRVPGIVGTRLVRAGVALLAASLLLMGAAEASGGWKRGYAAIVIDANTGRVLHQENADELRHPASVTKVMTLYLLFEQMEAGRLRPNSQLKVSSFASKQQPSKLGVKAGSTISVEDAILSLITRSANDVAVVVAENISGSSSNFASLMTRRARQLGMSRTTFTNPNGLPDQRMVTTARDLAVLGRAVQERFPQYYGYFEKRSFQYRGAAIRNHNRLLGRVEGVDGIKTGYTNASGFNLLTSVKRDGRYVIAVVLGGRSGATRDNRMAELIKEALPRAQSGRQMIARLNSAPGDVPVPALVAMSPASIPTPPEAPAINPAVIPVPVANPRLAMASAAGPAPQAIEEPVPAPLAPPAPVANSQNGSAAPIVPVAVKTVAVARPSTPTATFSNQPGILGTLSFAATPAPAPAAPAQRALREVQVASLGATELPPQITEQAERNTPPRTGWAIQIGAFGSEEDARSQLAKAKQKASGALSNADPYTEEGTRGATRFVRARFAGFEGEAAARKACQALKRSDFGCMVFRN